MSEIVAETRTTERRDVYGHRRSDLADVDAFRLGTRVPNGWHPPFDVVEVADGFVVAVDVPGVDADALELNVKHDVLTVSGERRPLTDGEVQREERPSGRFVRRFQLPGATEPEAISARLTNGVLELRIPRTATPEERRVRLLGPEA